jgi:hypothetical protein
METMISNMARIHLVFIVVGFLIVVAALIVGHFNSQTAAAYFAASKSVRETTLMAQRVAIESTGLWLPYFKFLGIGLLLSGIVMALRVIIDNLKAAGGEVLGKLPTEKRPAFPKPPWFTAWMPILMLLGLAIFVIALLVSLWLAGIAGQVFAHPLPEVDAAGAGSALLGQVRTIHTVSAWLVPFKFLGVATEFLAIVLWLATIIFVLEVQTKLMEKGVEIARAAMKKAG